MKLLLPSNSSNKDLQVCTTASAPPGALTHWEGRKYELASSKIKEARHFPVNLRNTSPMAIGRIPPSFLLKPIRKAPARKGWISEGTNPFAKWLIKSVRISRAGVWLWTWIALRIWLARIPDGPAAEPLLKERNFLSTSEDSIKIGTHSEAETKSEGTSWTGCFSCNFRIFSSVGSTRASEISEAEAAERRPSATIWTIFFLLISARENFSFGRDSQKETSSFHIRSLLLSFKSESWGFELEVWRHLFKRLRVNSSFNLRDLKLDGGALRQIFVNIKRYV